MKSTNADGPGVLPNRELSVTDRLYMICNYPPDVSKEDGASKLVYALDSVGVPASKRSEILDSFKTDKSGLTARPSIHDMERAATCLQFEFEFKR